MNILIGLLIIFLSCIALRKKTKISIQQIAFFTFKIWITIFLLIWILLLVWLVPIHGLILSFLYPLESIGYGIFYSMPFIIIHMIINYLIFKDEFKPTEKWMVSFTTAVIAIFCFLYIITVEEGQNIFTIWKYKETVYSLLLFTLALFLSCLFWINREIKNTNKKTIN